MASWLPLSGNQLGTKRPESQERIAKAIEALKYKRVKIENELEHCKPKKYRRLSKIQKIFKFLSLTQPEKDLVKIESIINNLNSYTRISHSSETIIQDIIAHLSSEIFNNISKISPKRIGLFYKLEELLRLISQKDISHFNSSDTIAEMQSKIDRLNMENEIYKNENENWIQRSEEKDRELRKLQNSLSKKEEEIKSLKNKPNQDFNLESLKGNYIGNLSKKGKYHFYEKCRDFKSLAREYTTHSSDKSRRIFVSKNPDIFINNGLKLCENCSKKRKKK